MLIRVSGVLAAWLLVACSDRSSHTAESSSSLDAGAREAGATDGAKPAIGDAGASPSVDAGAFPAVGDAGAQPHDASGDSDAGTEADVVGIDDACTRYLELSATAQATHAAMAELLDVDEAVLSEAPAFSKPEKVVPGLASSCIVGRSPREMRDVALLANARWVIGQLSDPAQCAAEDALVSEYTTTRQLAAAHGVPETSIRRLLEELESSVGVYGSQVTKLAARLGTEHVTRNWMASLGNYMLSVKPFRVEHLRRIRELPGIERADFSDSGASQVEAEIRQPYDHDNPDGPSFAQRVQIEIAGYDLPNLLGTGGYAFAGSSELTSLLVDTNRVGVAHRFYADPPADPALWQFLTPEQAAADVHRVIDVIEPLLAGKWVTHGLSKDGSSALIHKRYYPEDVVGTVAYVAPLGFEDDLDRGLRRILAAQDQDCVAKVYETQLALLDNLVALSELEGWEGADSTCLADLAPEALWRAAAAYEWTFWVEGRNASERCAQLAATGTTLTDLARELTRYVAPHEVDPADVWEFEKAATWGEPQLRRMDVAERATEAREALGLPVLTSGDPPWMDEPEYTAAVMTEIREWLAEHGEDVVLVYGASDPWSAWPVVLAERATNLVVNIPDGQHWVSTLDAEQGDREAFRRLLERWLGEGVISEELWALD